MRKYRKKDCKYCQEASSKTIFKIEGTSFVWKLNDNRNPIVIYKWHDEPLDKEIEEVLVWAKSKFKFRTPDFRRRIPDHFSFELVYAPASKVDVPLRKTEIQCLVCNNFVPIEDTKDTKEGILVCSKCYHKAEKHWDDIRKILPELADRESEEEAQYELIQYWDMDGEDE